MWDGFKNKIISANTAADIVGRGVLTRVRSLWASGPQFVKKVAFKIISEHTEPKGQTKTKEGETKTVGLIGDLCPLPGWGKNRACRRG